MKKKSKEVEIGGKKVSKLTDLELQKHFKEADTSIYVTECYGMSDFAVVTACADELENRGYTISIDNDKYYFTQD